MGTRAQFFIGDPQDIEGRIWLGTVAWDGYPDGDMELLKFCKTEDEFRSTLYSIITNRDDYCDPKTQSFPFPWKDDLFLTDCTYAFRDGYTYFNYFHSRPMKMIDYLNLSDETRDQYNDEEDYLPSNVKAPVNTGLPKGPDSIIIIGGK